MKRRGLLGTPGPLAGGPTNDVTTIPLVRRGFDPIDVVAFVRSMEHEITRLQDENAALRAELDTRSANLSTDPSAGPSASAD